MASYNRCELQLWKEASIRSTLTAYVRWEWPWEQCGKTNQIINVIFVIYCTFMWFSVNGALLRFYLVSYKNANPQKWYLCTLYFLWRGIGRLFSSTEQFVNNTSVCNDDEDDEKKAKSEVMEKLMILITHFDGK